MNNIDIVRFFEQKLQSGNLILLPNERKLLGRNEMKAYLSMVRTYENFSFYTKNINGKSFLRIDCLKFMFNPENIYNCDDCPENRGFDGWENKKPCGQQVCWVISHCRDMDY
jgi:hypothetical protein